MRLPVLLAAALVLAGCTGSPQDAPTTGAQASADFEELDLTAGATTGLIRGVVVDGAIAPIAGAAVTLTPGGTNATTDDEGRFGFSDLEPGVYFVSASKAGFSTQQTSVDVVAGEAEPRITTLRLDRLPGTEPYAMALQWNGFMACSFTIAIAFGTGCLVGDQIDDNSRRFDPVDRPPAFLQSELDWDTTQALGSNLCMRHYASEDIGGDILMDDVCGPAPLMQQANASALDETAVGSGAGLERVVWVDDAVVDLTFGLALNQRFTVYTHLFYNFVPDEGWTFLEDGAPEPPA